MRSSAVLQALTSEAAAVVKQAVVLAKRRDHAQVTPMHVATTMLAAGGGLLRAACLQSHSHPLQCKALELCFNVALNRLPNAYPRPINISGYYSHHPSISNALVAAFKRAQSHHRRGAPLADNQQQILRRKIELEHLIISILDDPSVSRVMREAGFSSLHVKNNIVEKSISSSSSPTPPRKSKENKVVILESSSSPPLITDQNEDLNIIIEALAMRSKNRSFVVVGESISNVEKTVRELMDRVESGGVLLPEALREVKFITIPPFYTFCNVRRELVQQKMEELTLLVKSHVGKGVVLFLGDLKWISEYRVQVSVERDSSVEHMIMEVGRLVSEMEETHGRFWVMGIGTFQTYMRCRNGYNNSLEKIWRLHPLTTPANNLGLTLVSSQSGNERDDDQNGSSCQLQVKFETQKSSSLPPWLKDESRRLADYNDQNCHDSVKANSTHSHRQPMLLERRSLTLSSASPSSSTSCFSFDQNNNPNLHQAQYLSLSTPNSPSSADTQKFKDLNANNLNTLYNALEEKVPHQKQIIPEIAGAILQCRSRMVRRKHKVNGNDLDLKEDTWLFFLGQDVKAKEEISRNVANFVFGSYSKFVSIGIMNRDDRDCGSYGERFAREVSANPHRVFLLQDFERVDCSSRMRIKRAIERGRIMSGEGGEEFSLLDAIVVLSSERFSSSSEIAGRNGGGGGVSLDLNMAFGEDDGVQKLHSLDDDLGILEIVDRIVVFKIDHSLIDL